MSMQNRALPIRKASRNRRAGQSATEYILLIAFIALIGVGVASMMGSSVQGILGNINAQLQAAFGTKACAEQPGGVE